MNEMPVWIVLLTTAVRDERVGLSCPSASLFQNKDPGYDIIQFNSFNINTAVGGNIHQLSDYSQMRRTRCES